MKKHLYLSLLIVLAVQVWPNKALAQLPFTFTQSMNNLTYVNNAYSTIDDAPNVSVVGHKQWMGIDGAPSSYLLNGSIPIASITGTAGLTLLNDNIGPESLTEINGFFAKKVQLSGTTYLSAAINAGFRTHKVIYSNLDPTDPSFQNSDINQTVTNVGFSVMYYSSNFYVGVSLPRLSLNKSQSDAFLQDTYYLTGAYLFNLSEDFKLKPAALVSLPGTNLPIQANLSTILYIRDVVGIGASYSTDKVAVGSNYRTNNAVAGIFSINYNNQIQFGYSYQFSVGQYALGGINNTTQEITLSYRFGKTLTTKLL